MKKIAKELQRKHMPSSGWAGGTEGYAVLKEYEELYKKGLRDRDCEEVVMKILGMSRKLQLIEYFIAKYLDKDNLTSNVYSVLIRVAGLEKDTIKLRVIWAEIKQKNPEQLTHHSLLVSMIKACMLCGLHQEAEHVLSEYRKLVEARKNPDTLYLRHFFNTSLKVSFGREAAEAVLHEMDERNIPWDAVTLTEYLVHCRNWKDLAPARDAVRNYNGLHTVTHWNAFITVCDAGHANDDDGLEAFMKDYHSVMEKKGYKWVPATHLAALRAVFRRQHVASHGSILTAAESVFAFSLKSNPKHKPTWALMFTIYEHLDLPKRVEKLFLSLTSCGLTPCHIIRGVLTRTACYTHFPSSKTRQRSF
eukprot:TRINITY_DN1959_c4_g1_i1.p1 TRINITY_DN1959_c4_g1~~TRINITY_DN1959_c4_g1_i1.p1  ORF type:complete len:362 (+),score=59.07 TRINITY_DN1959_c4_g1_i1:225-1310(+)